MQSFCRMGANLSVDGDLLDALDACIVATTLEGVVTTANRAACRILGVTKAELVGRDIGHHVAPLADMRERARGQVRLAEGKTYSYSVALHQPAAPQYVILFEEVSQVAELRSQRDRLLQMAALGDALPCILHELKNPLAAVSTMLEVMIEDPRPVSTDDLYMLLREVRRIHLTLQGVGGFAAPLRSRKHEAVDLAVQEACRVLEPSASRRGIELVCEPRALPLLPLDRNVMSGVVFNLVRNAIDACSSGNHINVDATLEDGGNVFVLGVGDDGPGMTPEVAARATELFFTNKPKGSGIGLALCKEVAAAAGGTLDLRSAPGAGTEVQLRVPVKAIDRGLELR